MAVRRLLALAIAIPLAAQTTHGHSWASVRALAVRDRVSGHPLDTLWIPQREGLVKGTLDSVSEDSLVLCAEVSSLQSIPKSSIRKVKVFRAPRKRMAVTLITSGLTAILMFGVIPDKLYDFPKSIMLPLAAGVTAPVTYFVYRGMRMRTVYRADRP
ncbi:MAG: hypothetical protein OXN97_03755 [Bryobacterales bacterium]|nr:hypothetical protein [Bryobacterales bacterium]